MRRRLCRVLIALATPSVCQISNQSVVENFSSACGEVLREASTYLAAHGLAVQTEEGARSNSAGVPFSEVGIWGWTFEPGSGKRIPWTDDGGRRVNDFRVYWTYADRKSVERLPFGEWHLQLAHYAVNGGMKMIPANGVCEVRMALQFVTDGARMRGILGLDASWSYDSNGRLS